MQSTWDETDAGRYLDDLESLVYVSRLVGKDPALVLYGGGNTSVKVQRPNIEGEQVDTLLVKGSGVDLKNATAEDFTPLRLERLQEVTRRDALPRREMARELRLAMLDPDAPQPSVEALLHAVIPRRFVVHTHADAVLALTNTPSPNRHIRDGLGADVLAMPYEPPGFPLAHACALLVPELSADIIGVVLIHHGVVTFGDTARQAYERTIEIATRAESYAQRQQLPVFSDQGESAAAPPGHVLAELRAQISATSGFPLILSQRRDRESLSFARSQEIERLSQGGPVTPDHVIWTKRVPMIGRDVVSYARAYRSYFERFANTDMTMIDPAPRIVLDPELGLCAAGRNATEADCAAEIYRHTIDVIRSAESIERWQALPPEDVFGVEYWDLERAKLRRNTREFEGEIALVTGAASGIGAACARAFLARGAAVCGLDVNQAVTRLEQRPEFLGLSCDVTRENELRWALEACAHQFGGLDMLILSAGVFTASAPLDGLALDEWRRVFAINTDANVSLLRLAFPFLKLAPCGGRVIVIGSKNVHAPGPGAAAYSSSKAALTQLARVAALEWGPGGVRVNVIHPDAVFDTGIWTDEVIGSRAARYGLTPEEYRTRNVLKTEVASRDVAELAATMCGTVFRKTTGAQVPIDGGNERVI